MSVRTHVLLATSLAATFLGAPACVVSVDHEGVIEREEKRFTVEKTPELHLYTFDGAVEVRSWDRPEVVVHIEKRGQDKDVVSKIEVLSTQKGDRLEVDARHSGRTTFVGIGVYRSPSARLIASVPRNTNLVIRTGDGSVVVERINGHAEIRTGDGSIRVTETEGDLLAETSDGSIQIEDVTGRIEARTGDGSIRLSGMPTSLRARTGDGSVALRIRTGATMAEDWMVATGDGSVSVELPQGFSAEVEADPGSGGRVRNDLTLTSQAGGTREARTLRGVLGQGGHRFTLRTGDGTIRLTHY
jgi:Putative adhesin